MRDGDCAQDFETHPGPCRREFVGVRGNPRLSDGERHVGRLHAVSKVDGSQTLDLQRDALLVAGVDPDRLYEDLASGRLDDRPGLTACLKALRNGDVLVVWKLDRLGRNLHHLVNTVHDLTARRVGLKVLTGQGVAIDTTAAGKLVFGIFAALAEFERELISERTVAGLASARARGRTGGRHLRPCQLGIARQTLSATSRPRESSDPTDVASSPEGRRVSAG